MPTFQSLIDFDTILGNSAIAFQKCLLKARKETKHLNNYVMNYCLAGGFEFVLQII